MIECRLPMWCPSPLPKSVSKIRNKNILTFYSHGHNLPNISKISHFDISDAFKFKLGANAESFEEMANIHPLNSRPKLAYFRHAWEDFMTNVERNVWKSIHSNFTSLIQILLNVVLWIRNNHHVKNISITVVVHIFFSYIKCQSVNCIMCDGVCLFALGNKNMLLPFCSWFNFFSFP